MSSSDPYAPPPSGWGPPPAPGEWGGSPQPWSGPQETEAKSVVALVAAIGSFLLIPFVLAVAALFVASAAKRDIAASGGRLTGGQMATAAQVIAWANIALSVLAVVLFVLLFVVFGALSVGLAP